ncbi:MAG: 4a-hydroxytetrahydrobiopterin dehydratase [Thermoprotei archaeon]
MVIKVTLKRSEIELRLAKLENWKLRGRRIVRTVRFKTFLDAINFINRVAIIAEHKNHHPDLRISYNRVTVSLITHDVKGITDLDFQLAEIINKIIDNFKGKV